MFPVDDWQFWVVTVAALGAAGWLLRGVWGLLIPSRRRGRRAKRASLTVEGKSISK